MVKFAKAIAANTDLSTAQVFVFPHEDIYLAFLISASGKDIFTPVRQLSADIEESFFSSDVPIAERLSDALTFIKENLKAEEINVALVCWKSASPELTNILYIQSLGNQSAFVVREKKAAELFSGAQSGQLISGYIQPNDRFILLNQTAAESFDQEGILSLSLDNFEDEVDSLAVTNPSSPPLAGILIDFSSDIPQEETLTGEVSSPMGTKIAQIRQRLLDILPKSSKARLYLVAAVLLVGLILVTLILNRHGASQEQARFQGYFTNAENEFNQAKSLKDSDAEVARQALNKSNQDLTQALKIKPQDSSALDLKKQIDLSSPEILKISTISNWPLYLDLALLKDGFHADRLSLSAGKILLLDSKQKTLIMVDLAQKTNQVLGGADQLGQAEFASLNGEYGFVYSDRGVVKIDTQAVKSSVAIKPDSDWGRIADILGFGGNVYLLDSIKNQVWKYLPTASAYSDKISYLRDKADFSSAKRMMIDSSVWILKSGGEIDKYTQGVADNFNIGGLDKPIKDTSSFFVSSDTDNVYLVDAPNSRVLILKKDGAYVSQIIGDKFSDASDLMIDEKGKKLYLLEQNKIYQIDLK